jgi:hypothetical protein
MEMKMEDAICKLNEHYGVDELPIPATLPDDKKTFYGIEMMRVVNIHDNYTKEPVEGVHVELADVMDEPESWGETLADAAFAIARDLYDGDLSRIQKGFLEELARYEDGYCQTRPRGNLVRSYEHPLGPEKRPRGK